MGFQTTIRRVIGSGFPGAFAYSGDYRVVPATIDNGATGANCHVGRLYSALRAAPTKAFPGAGEVVIGIAIHGNSLVNNGGANPLDASTLIPLGAQAEFAKQTPGVFVNLVANAAATEARAGDYVLYNNSTGELSPLPVGGTVPAGWTWLQGAKVLEDGAVAVLPGLSVISLIDTGELVAPAISA